MIFVDIDNTIAGRNMSAFARHFNMVWQLGVPETQLKRIGYRTFFTLPEVERLRSRFNDEQWELEIQKIDQSPGVLVRQRVLPFAVEGITSLAQWYPCSLSYCTVRKDQEAVQQATRTWLTDHHFPYADHILFCRNITQKFVHIFCLLQKQPHPVLLIDDMYDPLLEVFHQLQQGTHRFIPREQGKQIVDLLQEYLTLVAFHADALPALCYGLRVLALPTWEQVDLVRSHLTVVDNCLFFKRKEQRWIS